MSRKPEDVNVRLLLDKMKIKSGLAFSKSSRLMRFGKVNDEIEQLATAIQGDQQRLTNTDRQVAKQMLVLMVRSIAKPSFTFPVAQYPTTKLTGEKLFPVV